MMRRFMCGALFCAFLIAPAARAEELTAEDIKGLAKGADNRDRVPQALKVYPAAAEYEIKVKFWQPGKEPINPDPVVAREKLVNGKYLVSTFRPPALPSDLIMVVFHDEDDDCYKKYVLLRTGHWASRLEPAPVSRAPSVGSALRGKVTLRRSC